MPSCADCGRPFRTALSHKCQQAAASRNMAVSSGAVRRRELHGTLVEETPAQKRRKLHTSVPMRLSPVITASPSRPEEIDVHEPSPSPTSPIFEEPVPSPPQARPIRVNRRPARVNDQMPEAGQGLAPGTARQVVRLLVRDSLRTASNSYGVSRFYLHRPSFDPNLYLRVEDLAVPRGQKDPPVHGLPSNVEQQPKKAPPPAPWPYQNWTKWLYARWATNGVPTKSYQQINELAEIISEDGRFKPDELKGFDAGTDIARAQQKMEMLNDHVVPQFRKSSVKISIPSGVSGQAAADFTVDGLLHQNLIHVVRAAFEHPLAYRLHFSPFKLYHRVPGSTEDIRIYGELYNCDAFIAEDDNVKMRSPKPPDDPHCTLERIVAALMFSSDATHLANFGTAKAWPIYLMLGNLSKYVRALPSSDSMYHVAYLPTLPDHFQDWLAEKFPKYATVKTMTKTLKTHCQRELMQAIWDLMLDKEFMHAYEYGIVVDCVDGIRRRVFPRIFTYSADYPEKILLASIRDNCMRCLTKKDGFDDMGSHRDMQARVRNIRVYFQDKINNARRAIYNTALSFKSNFVERILMPFSLIPTVIELGVWKALIVHMIRILFAWAKASKEDVVAKFNIRFRTIRPFGRGTIRQFSNNTTDLKKMAARDYEDILQCAIPVVEGLLPDQLRGIPVQAPVLVLLYRFAEWHALAKLRMHTDTTLDWFTASTKTMGRLLRHFRDTICPLFDTYELAKESSSRTRREKAQQEASGSDTARVNSAARPRKLNLNTYKFHAMGDYPAFIKIFGTTDSYSTQMGELAHRLVKALYRVTNKGATSMKQIADKVTRKQFFSRQTAELERNGLVYGQDAQLMEEQMELVEASQQEHYHIALNKNKPIHIVPWLQDGDPAKDLFLRKLRDHILGWSQGLAFDGDETQFTDEQRAKVDIINNVMYQHQVMRVNYTTYDILRDYDIVNPLSQCFIMLRSPDDSPGQHPYWYAQVLGIYHADVRVRGEVSSLRPTAKHFLYVRWLGDEPGWVSGRRVARLPKIGFVPEDDMYAFGFLDPDLVIRGAHLIPAFAGGRTLDLLNHSGPTLARQRQYHGEEDVDDWVNFYVNIFVDRDMAMRYFGGGVGHVMPITPEPDVGDADDGLDNDGGNTEGEGQAAQIGNNWFDKPDEEDEDEESSEDEDEDKDGDDMDSSGNETDDDANTYADF